MSLEQFKQHRQVLWEYLLMKVERQDFHGIRDCCVDIEVIDAMIKVSMESKQ